mmetsp:Transcript_27453/g.40317  ORF Transcript_27453/g.40317 Transcript_27453/m.40317 type:complete len:183 (-) Transcript_27453:364-912(-)
MDQLNTQGLTHHSGGEEMGSMTLDVPPNEAEPLGGGEDDGLLADTPTTANDDDSDVPIELQLEQVDMDDPKMDALEWGVRKVVPIPKKYYWETGNYDLPLKTKAWHRLVGTGAAAVRFLDRIGQPVTEASGLTSSRFSYVTDTMTERQWEKAQDTASRRKLQHEAEREANTLEEGQDGDVEE